MPCVVNMWPSTIILIINSLWNNEICNNDNTVVYVTKDPPPPVWMKVALYMNKCSLIIGIVLIYNIISS